MPCSAWLLLLQARIAGNGIASGGKALGFQANEFRQRAFQGSLICRSRGITPTWLITIRPPVSPDTSPPAIYVGSTPGQRRATLARRRADVFRWRGRRPVNRVRNQGQDLTTPSRICALSVKLPPAPAPPQLFRRPVRPLFLPACRPDGITNQTAGVSKSI